MPIWGLTGGIASGKSTVHRALSMRGADVLDADAVYHRLIAPQTGTASILAQRVARRFPRTLNSDGSIDRQALGARVFKDPTERRALEEITHPAVAEEVARLIGDLQEQGVEHIFYDVPLLYELGLDKDLAGVVVVWVPRDIQLSRLMQRDSLDLDSARARLDAQWPLDEKRRRARWTIDNSGTLGATHTQVDHLWQEIQGLKTTSTST